MIAACGMVRDEEDIVGFTLDHLMDEGVDRIIIADNLSTDGTREILEDRRRVHPDIVTIVDDTEPGYYQSRKMTALAQQAADAGAEWIIPFDADELHLAPDRIAVWLRDMAPHINQVHVPIYNHFPTGQDEPGPNPFLALTWRQPLPAPLYKVAFRWQPGAVIEQGNHHVTLPEPGVAGGGITLRHYSWRSFEQWSHKVEVGAAAYAATDLPDDYGAHWRSYGQILRDHGIEALRAVYDRWFTFVDPAVAGLVHDPAPWCRWTRNVQP